MLCSTGVLFSKNPFQEVIPKEVVSRFLYDLCPKLAYGLETTCTMTVARRQSLLIEEL